MLANPTKWWPVGVLRNRTKDINDFISNLTLVILQRGTRKLQEITLTFNKFSVISFQNCEQVILILTFGLLLKNFYISHNYGTKRSRI